MKEYIKSLPKPWIVNKWRVPMVCLSFALILSAANQLFFEIYTGVMVSGITPGTKFDAIWILFGIIIGVIWILVGPKMDKKNILENNMRSIYGIAFRKS